ncbi:MAG: hypothetical protein HQ536_05020, partial [Parcubacteria group bacterium]|nr:hypothetical protein [Parcubacteria group bacterium]
KISFSPKETKKHKSVCPKCGKKLTVGVLNRVEELADQDVKHSVFNTKCSTLSVGRGRIPYKSLIPLQEIIAEAKSVGPLTKTVRLEYDKLIEKFGSEFFVLLDADLKKISKVTDAKIAEGVKRIREGKVKIEPGYDGEYGKISLFEFLT